MPVYLHSDVRRLLQIAPEVFGRVVQEGRFNKTMRLIAWHGDLKLYGINEVEETFTETAIEPQSREWPVLVKLVAVMRKESDRGVGDTVARVIGPAGGDAFKEWMDKLGLNCGCGERQEWLNGLYPY